MMPLRFHPKPGTVLICDYRTGFRSPEMVKRRPVVVISPRFRRRRDLCTVVPLSTKRPEPKELYHHRLTVNPVPGMDAPVWAKCDMLATVSMSRLDRVKIGRRRYLTPFVSEHDLLGIRRSVLHALGMEHLILSV